MPFRRAVVAATLASAVLASTSAVGAPGYKSLTGIPTPKLTPFGQNQTQTVCKVGFPGDPVGAVDFGIAFGDVGGYDRYWTYIEMDPAVCPGCGAGYAGTLSAAHLVMYYPSAPETVTVNVYLARSGLGPCYQPDIVNPMLAGPVQYTFTVNEAASAPDVELLLPPGWTITSPFGQNANAYLGIEFVSATDTISTHAPLLTFVGSALNCRTWNQTGFQLYDYVSQQYTPGNLLFYADIAQCDLVPVKRKSWGELKVLYR